MADEDFEEFISSEQRKKVLGFVPQRETVINCLLPYFASLDDESRAFFAQIKTNFAKAVMLREMKPGCGVWTGRLMKYISIYGLKFSKEDHVTLVKLVYELMTIPDLEPSKLNKLFTLFLMLTKKRYLLSPEDLELPWRPLYEVGVNLFEKSRTEIGMFHYPSIKRGKEMEEDPETVIKNVVKRFMSGTGFDDTFSGISDMKEFPMSMELSYNYVLKYAKMYFPETATKEMLDVFLPQLEPWSNSTDTIAQMVMILPVTLKTSKAACGHELWFDRLFDFWVNCHNTSCGVLDLFNLFTSLSKHNPGAIDWEKHVPFMFSRFMHSMQLPVGYKEMQYNKANLLDTKIISTWIVWNIKPGGTVLTYLRTFLNGLSSYFHSANNGRWSFKLRDFLRSITREFLGRVRREREKAFKTSWMNAVPPSHKLGENDITEFVEILLESTISALNYRLEITSTLHHLALLRPAIVIPPLLDKLRSSLESLTEPQKLTTALQAVCAVARPMLCGPAGGYKEGPTHVVPLLMASLPGLDSNDLKKTLCTLQFIAIFIWMVPIIDCSSAPEYYDDLTEEERFTCETTAQFEDFVLLYLDRVFIIIESSVQEQVRPETDVEILRSKFDSIMEMALFTTTSAVINQSSPKIFDEALRKFRQFVFSANYETSVSGNIVGILLKVFSRHDPETILASFLPQLCDQLDVLLSSDDVLVEENPSRELLYRLHLLANVVDCKGVGLLKYVPRIMKVLDRGLKQEAKEAINKSCSILSFMMMSLSTVDIIDYKSVSLDYGNAPKEWLPIRLWGKGCKFQDAKFKWHIPNEEEVACCQKLIDTYLKPEMEQWELWMNGEREMNPKQRLRSLSILSAVTRCPNLMSMPQEESVPMIDTVVPPTSFPLVSAIKYHVTLNGENFRVAFAQFLRKIQTKILQDAADDTRSIDVLIRLWERVSGVRNSRSGPGLECRMRSYNALQRSLDGRGGAGSYGRVRTLLADALIIQEEARYDLHSEAGITKNGMLILKSLFELSVSSYATVRHVAQVRLSWMLSHNAYSYRAVVPLLKELFEKGGDGDEWHARHKGALYISFQPKCSPLITKPDWEVIKTIWPLILNAPLKSEKPSILKLEQHFLDTIHRQCSTINTTLTIPDSCVESAKQLLTIEELEDPLFTEQLAKAREYEEQISEKNVRHYKELLQNLVDIFNKPNVIWSRLELLLMTFNYCPSLQVPYTPNVIRIVTDSLIHDDIQLRKIAVKLLQFIMKQIKIKTNTTKIDICKAAGVPKSEKITPGYRADNQWVMWSDKVMKTDDDWEKPFLRKVHMGFYTWPDTLEVALPSHKQDFLKHTPEDMEEGERYIYEKLIDDVFVEKWVRFLTAEDKKGKDKFSGLRFGTLKIIFRNFGYPVASKFLDHAKKHATRNQESAHRFVCEVVAAALRAPKYWGREQVDKIYDDVIEVLRIALFKITPDTFEDWGTTIASGVDQMDAQRLSKVIKALFVMCSPPPYEDPEANNLRSFGICSRLFALQGVLSSLTWRGVHFCNTVLEKLESANYIQHPYQNVRETVGSSLTSIFDLELSIQDGDFSAAPKYGEFIARAKSQLTPLYDEHGEIAIKSSISTAPMSPCNRKEQAMTSLPEPASTGEQLVAVAKMKHLSPEATEQDEGQTQEGPDENETKTLDMSLPEKTFVDDMTGIQLESDTTASNQKEHAKAINLITTVLRGAMGLIIRGVNTHIKTQYELVRIACALSTRGPSSMNDELARAADGFLAALVLADHSEDEFDTALTTLTEVAASKSWWARLACVDYAQPLLFYGLPYLRQCMKRARRAENLALKLMRDPRLEVRRAAAKILTGLMHCQALADENATIENLMRSCRSKNIVERHFGVLGLCGYLCSKPYGVAPKIGIVLAELSRHTSAPDPIPSTIVSALADFRRTHQDDWARHRQAMTEEELDLLADLTSPPSYCA